MINVERVEDLQGRQISIVDYKDRFTVDSKGILKILDFSKPYYFKIWLSANTSCKFSGVSIEPNIDLTFKKQGFMPNMPP